MFKKYEVKLVLTREMLGTNPITPDIHAEHIIAKARKIMTGADSSNKKLDKFIDAMPISNEKEASERAGIIRVIEERNGGPLAPEQLEALKETVEDLDSRGVTVFFRNESGRPTIGSHMIKGYLKAAGESICGTKTKKAGTMLQSKAFTDSTINQHLSIVEEFIEFDKDIDREVDGAPKYCVRPLRAETMQGPRVSIAKSEVVKAGATLKFTVVVMEGSPLTEEILSDLFSVGEYGEGLGQWRGSGGKGKFTYDMHAVSDKKAA